ncbi:MAG: hypothetical protein WDW36_002108 [Sanguina aurantia]
MQGPLIEEHVKAESGGKRLMLQPADLGNLSAENSAFLRNRSSSCSGIAGDVELTSLSSGVAGFSDSNTMFMPPSTAGSTTRMHELMRRRPQNSEGVDSDGWNEDGDPSERGSSWHAHPSYSLHQHMHNNHSSGSSHSQHPTSNSPMSKLRPRSQPGLLHPCEPIQHQPPGISSNGTRHSHGSSRASRSFLPQQHHPQAPTASPCSQQQLETIFNWKNLALLGRSIGESAIVQKIKAAANQPALAGGASVRVGLLDAADGVLASLGSPSVGGAKPGGGGGGSARPPLPALHKLSSPAMSRSSSQMNVRLKESAAKQE